MIRLSLNLTRTQFYALYDALAGRVEDAHVFETEEEPLTEDKSLEPIVEALDAIHASLAD